MMKRTAIRPSEVSILYGISKKVTEWQLWQRMCDGDNEGPGEFGRWTARLAEPIAAGIIADHGLVEDTTANPKSSELILAPRLRILRPSLHTNGKPAGLVTTIRNSAGMFGWKEPGTMPERNQIQLRAIAAAYELDHIYYGVLVDGYTSQLYHYQTNAEERAELLERVERFIDLVVKDEEPEIDFTLDASAVRRQPKAIKAQASNKEIEAVATEYAENQRNLAKAKNEVKPLENRHNELTAIILHMIGERDLIETERYVISATSERGTRSVKITDKAPPALF